METTDLSSLVDEYWDLLAQSPDKGMVPALRMLAQHLDNPRSYVTFAGETSSGKSTLINSFLGRKFLAAGACPTTGTVTWIEYGLADRERLLAVNRNATIEELSSERFRAFSLKPDADLLRLKAEIPGSKSEFKGLSIFDTPGFNAIVSEHAEVLKEFLPESDVVVYPVSYKVGFGSSDRQLMELIGDVRKHLGTFPVVLVVNRTPEGVGENDSRIREIRQNAEDSLHESVPMVVIRTSMPAPTGESTLPDTDDLWRKIGAIVSAPERAYEIRLRLTKAVESLLRQRAAEMDTQIAAAAVGEEGIEELKQQLISLGDEEAECYRIVEKYMARLAHEVPKLIQRGAEKLVQRAETEISDSNKWTEASLCRTYIHKHVLPFSTTEVVREVEGYVMELTDQMDGELDERANRAIRRLNEHAQTISNPQLKELAKNLGLQLGQQLAGVGANHLLKGLGGAGGAAVGLGNLAKMGVKQVGKLFGKKFSRQVYVEIGKIFTKKAVQAMSVAVQVVVEAVMAVWDANRWQGQLIEETKKIVRKWETEVCSEVSKSMVPDFQKTNNASVSECFHALRSEYEHAIDDAMKEYNEVELEALKEQRARLSKALQNLEK